MLQVLQVDEWGRPLELVPGTSATYGFYFQSDEETPVEEYLAWLRQEFAAECSAQLNPCQYNPTGQEPPEYGVDVTVPATHHARFRTHLDDVGREEEIPEGWERPKEWGE